MSEGVTEFTIDCLSWRCGVEGKHKLGNGITMMKNSFGEKCCLGFIAEQMGAKNLVDRSDPSSLRGDELPLVIPLLVEPLERGYSPANSEFSEQAVEINDNSVLTIRTKIRKLRALGEESGITIKFKNIGRAIEKSNREAGRE